ncbi:ABC-2 type transport system permease protein [Ignavigranum ruoffiae]|uniref:ABC-2 type transport system permease protein n=1 Tax=Ignavigranum ruoffiae TaxID=89093 RepID=A0A1H9A0Z8_9LACT|nr:ABC transporter permease [Ignavigranum ruoffiae]SEP70314.1 ABC-2 type transport system permease protein [Ignavigranum ruoffiae]
MSKLAIIIKEVYRKNVQSWSFFWMIAGPIITIAIVSLIVYFIGKDEMGQSSGRLAIISDQPEIVQLVETANEENTIIKDYSIDQARQAVMDQKIDGYITIEQKDPFVVKFYKSTTGSNINLTKIQQALNEEQIKNMAEKIGLNQDEIIQLQSSNVNIETINIAESKDGQTKETSSQDPKVFIRNGVAYFVVFMVFMFIMNYVSVISQEIATEKGSRIMEIILSSVSSTTHFYGKMIGISLVILTQIVIYIVLFLVLQFVFDQTDLMANLGLEFIDLKQIFAESKGIIGIGAVFALMGVLIYASLAGFLGSLVSKVEEVNKTITPITLFAVAGLYTGMFAMQSPNNIVVKVMSYIPLTTPFVMPFRISTETVAQNELIIAIIISVIFSIVCFWIATIFYRSNVLTYSDKGVINTLKRSFQLWKSDREAQD